MQKKVTIKNNKPRFLRIHSGEFNFKFDDMKNHVSIWDRWITLDVNFSTLIIEP